jgi:hypothetical protein
LFNINHLYLEARFPAALRENTAKSRTKVVQACWQAKKNARNRAFFCNRTCPSLTLQLLHPLLQGLELLPQHLDFLLSCFLLLTGRLYGTEAAEALIPPLANGGWLETGKGPAHKYLAVTALLTGFSGRTAATRATTGDPLPGTGEGFARDILAVRTLTTFTTATRATTPARFYRNPYTGSERTNIPFTLQGRHADHHIATVAALATTAPTTSRTTAGRAAVENTAGLLTFATLATCAPGATIGQDLKATDTAGIQAQINIHTPITGCASLATVAALAGPAGSCLIVMPCTGVPFLTASSTTIDYHPMTYDGIPGQQLPVGDPFGKLDTGIVTNYQAINRQTHLLFANSKGFPFFNNKIRSKGCGCDSGKET